MNVNEAILALGGIIGTAVFIAVIAVLFNIKKAAKLFKEDENQNDDI